MAYDRAAIMADAYKRFGDEAKSGSTAMSVGVIHLTRETAAVLLINYYFSIISFLRFQSDNLTSASSTRKQCGGARDGSLLPDASLGDRDRRHFHAAEFPSRVTRRKS